MILFSISLLLTFVITRILTHSLHDVDNYNSGTITGRIRQNTNFDFHHIHFGIIILIVLLILNFFFDINNIVLLIFLGISISLILDQLFPLLKICCYFSKFGIGVAILLHLLLLIILNYTSIIQLLS